MSVLISGSVAYDTILTYPGRFSDALIGERLNNLTVTFESSSCERRFGGCAANIAYSMKLLGGDPIVWASVGFDAQDYLQRFKALGIKTALYQSPDLMTAQCFTTVDQNGNQLSTFASNAMNEGNRAPWPADERPTFAIFAPDTREPMLYREAELLSHNVPFLFDPGQTIPQFSGAELLRLLSESFMSIVNTYEVELLMKKTGLDFNQLLKVAGELIVTKGREGASYHSEKSFFPIPAYPVADADPVGAGDAFRGALGYALERHLPMPVVLALASTIASFKTETHGTQNYRPTLAAIQNRFEAIFGKKFKLFD